MASFLFRLMYPCVILYYSSVYLTDKEFINHRLRRYQIFIPLCWLEFIQHTSDIVQLHMVSNLFQWIEIKEYLLKLIKDLYQRSHYISFQKPILN